MHADWIIGARAATGSTSYATEPGDIPWTRRAGLAAASLDNGFSGVKMLICRRRIHRGSESNSLCAGAQLCCGPFTL